MAIENAMSTSSGGMNAGTVYCQVAIRGIPAAVKDLQGFNSSVKTAATESRKEFGEIASSIDRTTVAMTAIAAAGAAAVGHVVKVAGAFEQLTISMETLLGNKDAAKEFLDDLREWEPRTPYTMEALSGFARQLMAAGIASKEIIPAFQAIGDMASALGANEMQIKRFVQAIQEIRNGAPLGRQLLRMTMDIPGFNPYKALADGMGKSVEEIHELQKKGALDAKEVTEALFKSMEKAYGGAMQKQMQSLNGQISSFKTKVWNAEIALGTALLPQIKGATASLGHMVDRFNSLTDAQKNAWAATMLGIPVTALGIAALTALTSKTIGLVSYTVKLSAALRERAQATLQTSLTTYEAVIADEAAAKATLDATLANNTATTAEKAQATAQYNTARARLQGAAVAISTSVSTAAANARQAATALLAAEAEFARTSAQMKAIVASELFTEAQIEQITVQHMAATEALQQAKANDALAASQLRVAQTGRAMSGTFLGLTPATWALVAAIAALFAAYKLYAYYQEEALKAVHASEAVTQQQIEAINGEIATRRAAIKELDTEKLRRQNMHNELERLLLVYEELTGKTRLTTSEHMKLSTVKQDLTRKMAAVRTELGMQRKAWDGNASSIKEAMGALVDFTDTEKKIFLAKAAYEVPKAKRETLEARKERQQLQNDIAWQKKIIADWEPKITAAKEAMEFADNDTRADYERNIQEAKRKIAAAKSEIARMSQLLTEAAAKEAYKSIEYQGKREAQQAYESMTDEQIEEMRRRAEETGAEYTALQQAKMNALDAQTEGKEAEIAALEHLAGLQTSEVKRLQESGAQAKMIIAAQKDLNTTNRRLAALRKQANGDAKEAEKETKEWIDRLEAQYTNARAILEKNQASGGASAAEVKAVGAARQALLAGLEAASKKASGTSTGAEYQTKMLEIQNEQANIANKRREDELAIAGARAEQTRNLQDDVEEAKKLLAVRQQELDIAKRAEQEMPDAYATARQNLINAENAVRERTNALWQQSIDDIAAKYAIASTNLDRTAILRNELEEAKKLLAVRQQEAEIAKHTEKKQPQSYATARQNLVNAEKAVQEKSNALQQSTEISLEAVITGLATWRQRMLEGKTDAEEILAINLRTGEALRGVAESVQQAYDLGTIDAATAEERLTMLQKAAIVETDRTAIARARIDLYTEEVARVTKLNEIGALGADDAAKRVVAWRQRMLEGKTNAKEILDINLRAGEALRSIASSVQEQYDLGNTSAAVADAQLAMLQKATTLESDRADIVKARIGLFTEEVSRVSKLNEIGALAADDAVKRLMALRESTTLITDSYARTVAQRDIDAQVLAVHTRRASLLDKMVARGEAGTEQARTELLLIRAHLSTLEQTEEVRQAIANIDQQAIGLYDLGMSINERTVALERDRLQAAGIWTQKMEMAYLRRRTALIDEKLSNEQLRLTDQQRATLMSEQAEIAGKIVAINREITEQRRQWAREDRENDKQLAQAKGEWSLVQQEAASQAEALRALADYSQTLVVSTLYGGITPEMLREKWNAYLAAYRTWVGDQKALADATKAQARDAADAQQELTDAYAGDRSPVEEALRALEQKRLAYERIKEDVEAENNPEKRARLAADQKRAQAAVIKAERDLWKAQFAGLGESIWDYQRDRSAIGRYFDKVAQEAGKRAFEKLWESFTRRKKKDGSEGPSEADKLLGSLLTSRIGRAIGLDKVAGYFAGERGKKLAAGALASYGAYRAITGNETTDSRQGTQQGALAGGMAGFQVGGPIGAAVGAIVGGLFGGLDARKRYEQEAQRVREQMLEELRKLNNTLTPMSDYFRSMNLNMLPSGMTYGAMATGYAATTSRGSW
jgi:hypothetical protein